MTAADAFTTCPGDCPDNSAFRLLDGLPALPSPSEMAEWDHAAIHDFGVREEMLMENASREALHVLVQTVGSVRNKTVLLFMGSGNNGGDAAALARHLLDYGARVLVLHTRPLSHYSGVTGYHLRLARRTGVPFRFLRSAPPDSLPPPFDHPDILVDGLLGTGFSGTLRPDMMQLVHWINAHRPRATIFALDIPSGLNGLTGCPCPDAVRAHATVTFEAAKTGLHMPPAAEYTGALHVRPIGIPAAVRTGHPATCRLLDTGIARALPRIRPDMHKGDSGHTVIIGGAMGMTGAAVLAAHGAARGGSGYVTLAAPAMLLPQMATGNPQFMTHALGQTGWPLGGEAAIADVLRKADAAVVGPGMGRDEPARALLHEVLAHPGRPSLVLDADALYHLAHHEALRLLLRPDDMLTPHPGEMAMLCGKTTVDVQCDRLATMRGFTVQYPCVLVLKGAGTLVGCKDRPVVLSPFAVPALAVAGSGDVLAGLAGGLLAQGVPAMEAACLAVYLHGRAGQLLQSEFPLRGNTATDIAHTLTLAKKELSPCLPPAI